MGECICVFPAECNGLGYLACEGCGGDCCVCAACFGRGEATCDGCAYCDHGDSDDDTSADAAVGHG